MIQMRPPADADNYRVQAGRFGDRFYIDPLPDDDTWDQDHEDHIYPAVSTVKKAVGQDWSRAMAKRLAKAPSQLVEIAGIDSEFERKERLNLLSDAGLDQASGRGTIVHQHIEARLMNRVPIYEMSDVVKPYIRTAESFLAAFNPTLVAAEFVAIHRSLNRQNLGRGCEFFGYGGTCDAVVEIDGQLYVVDWKSRAEDSPHKAYSEEAGQVSAYACADYWIVGDDELPNGARRVDPLDLAGGLIVSIKPDSYECFPIDLDAGFAYWADLHAWWQARRSERRPIKRKWAPRVAPDTSQLGPSDTEIVEAGGTVVRSGEGALDVGAPTPASNKTRFDALPEVKKGWAREAFKRKGINPNDPATAGEVSRILGEMEQRPSLREAQEQRAEQVAEHTERTMVGDPVAHVVEGEHVTPMEYEGGEATDEMIAESRLLFDMVIGEHGKTWCGHRVAEANVAAVPFQVSKLRSMRRANIYLALTRWAQVRGERLVTDEDEGNIEFASLLFEIDRYEGDLSLGARIGSLSVDEAEKFAASMAEVVLSELGDNPVTETETQPASEPASD